MNAIWSQTTEEKTARISLVNDEYVWKIFNRWCDRYGQKEAGVLLSTGTEKTLAQAKRAALAELIH